MLLASKFFIQVADVVDYHITRPYLTPCRFDRWNDLLVDAILSSHIRAIAEKTHVVHERGFAAFGETAAFHGIGRILAVEPLEQVGQLGAIDVVHPVISIEPEDAVRRAML
jgi:hypothetical protein